MNDKLPPFSIEAEQGVLGACLLSDRMADEVMMILKSEDYWRAEHQEVWTAMVALRDEGRQIDTIALAESLIRRGRFEAIGGDEYLRLLCGCIPHAANAAYHAGIVKDLAIHRRLIDCHTEGLKESYARQMTSAELVSSAETRIFAISDQESSGQTLDFGQVTGGSMDAFGVREKGDTTGLPTGFEDLDGLLGGFEPASLVIVAARPSIGKSALALAVASNVASDHRTNVLFVSLEMGNRELGDRMISMWSRVDGKLIKCPKHMNDRQREAIYAAAAQTARLTIHVDDTPTRTMSQIAANARRIKSRRGLGLVIVDYLGLISGDRQKNENRQEEVARISRRLKGMARELQVPVMALHQLNRQSEQREDRRPRLAELRESGAIEQDADVVLLLHRPEFYDANDQPGIAEVIVAKNRNGATGSVRLAFSKQCTRFDNLYTGLDPADAGPAF